MFFPTSKKSRAKWVERLTSDGVHEVAACQMAWAAFPFDDSHRPRHRDYTKTVRSESWNYLRDAKGVGYESGRTMAVDALVRWSRLAWQSDERYYGTVYGYLAEGTLPPE